MTNINNDVIDKDWFVLKLAEKKKSLRGLARHLNIDAAAVSRMLSGQRKMKIEEANDIAIFLGVRVQEVLERAGVEMFTHGDKSEIMLTATINEYGIMELLAAPMRLPPSFVEQYFISSTFMAMSTISAAQIRARTGPLSLWDDGIILFSESGKIDNSSMGSMAICRDREGRMMLAKIERARKTGEAYLTMPDNSQSEAVLVSASPILALIP